MPMVKNVLLVIEDDTANLEKGGCSLFITRDGSFAVPLILDGSAVGLATAGPVMEALARAEGLDPWAGVLWQHLGHRGYALVVPQSSRHTDQVEYDLPGPRPDQLYTNEQFHWYDLATAFCAKVPGYRVEIE